MSSTADAEILAELRGIRALLAQMLTARPAARGTAVRAADLEVLQVLRELLCAPPWKRDRLFTAAEALAMAKAHPDLDARMAAALGASPARALGKLLARSEGQAVDGAVVSRRSVLHGTTIWELSRVSRVSEPPQPPQLAARQD